MSCEFYCISVKVNEISDKDRLTELTNYKEIATKEIANHLKQAVVLLDCEKMIDMFRFLFITTDYHRIGLFYANKMIKNVLNIFVYQTIYVMISFVIQDYNSAKRLYLHIILCLILLYN